MKKLILGGLCMCLFVSQGFAARLWYQPQENTLVVNCPNSVDVMLDMEGQETTAMDLQMEFEGVQLGFFDGQGGLFRSYTIPSILSSGNRQTVYSLLSTMSRWGVGGSGKVATLKVVPDLGTETVMLSFSFIPGADDKDSNIIIVSGNTTYDVLTRADSLILPVREGSCDQMTVTEMQQQKKALETVLEQQRNERIVLLQNEHFVSQYPTNEFMDEISSGLVVQISTIVMIGLIVIVFIIAYFSYQKRKYIYQLTAGGFRPGP